MGCSLVKSAALLGFDAGQLEGGDSKTITSLLMLLNDNLPFGEANDRSSALLKPVQACLSASVTRL